MSKANEKAATKALSGTKLIEKLEKAEKKAAGRKTADAKWEELAAANTDKNLQVRKTPNSAFLAEMQKVADKVSAEITEKLSAAAKPKAKTPGEETSEAMAILKSRGWSDRQISNGVGLDYGSLTPWHRGSASRKLPELKKLVASNSPPPALKEVPAKKGSSKAARNTSKKLKAELESNVELAKVVKGSLKSSTAKASAPKEVRAPAGADPRQLMLDLRNAIDAVLAVTK